MARGALFQKAVVTAETDEFRIARFFVLFAWVSCNLSHCYGGYLQNPRVEFRVTRIFDSRLGLGIGLGLHFIELI